MLAVVSAPSFSSTTIRHIEVLQLQPRLVMVVVITSSGGVGKRIFRFEEPLDEGLIEFARVYLNERLAGAQVGSRLVDSAFTSPDLQQPRARLPGRRQAGLHARREGWTRRVCTSAAPRGW